jgi:large subunit ribosomal protein L15
MKLHELRPRQDAKRPRKRVGRGIAAGQGKTAGRGTKGQGARGGTGGNLYRQGGNLPFFRRLPFKRGFTNINRRSWNEVNLDRLVGFEAGSQVTPDDMLAAGLIRDVRNPVVILGRGKIKQELTVKAHRVSASAKAAIEKAGGKVELLKIEDLSK